MKYPKITALMAILLSVCLVSVALPQKLEVTFEADASVVSDDLTNQTNENIPVVVQYVFMIIVIILITMLLVILLSLASKIKNAGR